MSTSTVPAAGAVIYAKDISRVAAFYAQAIGFVNTHAEDGFIVLESAALQLVIVAMPDDIADEVEIATPPVKREETPIKLSLPVAAIQDVRLKAPALGGGLNGPEREWRFFGARVCDGFDPEGNIFQVRERP